MSARDANKVARRVAPIRTNAPAAHYLVRDPKTGMEYVGKLDVVQALCPNVKPTTLRARLAKGERDLDKLRRKPDSPHGRKMK